MKHFFLTLMAAGVGLAAMAQTNAPVQEKIVINSVSAMFNPKTDWVYTSHVRVDHPAMKLTCEWLTGNSPQTNNPDRHYLARTNVVIDLIADQGKQWHITCQQAVYNYHLLGTVTNETVTLTGNAIAKSDEDTITGEPLVYDMLTKSYSGSNFQMAHIMTNGISNATNSAGSKTNHASANPFLP